jgi:hypothetical protein
MRTFGNQPCFGKSPALIAAVSASKTIHSAISLEFQVFPELSAPVEEQDRT